MKGVHVQVGLKIQNHMKGDGICPKLLGEVDAEGFEDPGYWISTLMENSDVSIEI